MKTEQTLVLIKPDGVERGLVGQVISRFEHRGLKIVGLKMLMVSAQLASDHYGDFVERYTERLGLEKATKIKEEMVNFLTAGPIVAMAVEGIGACPVVRQMVGSTYPNEATPGTIRGDYAHMSQGHANEVGITVKNITHASGSPDEAKIELALWFDQSEICRYDSVHDKHILG